MENSGGFRAVEVFRLAVAQDAPAEADHPAAAVADREDDPVEEQLADPPAVLAAAQQPGFGQQVRLDAVALQLGDQPAAPVARPAEAEPADGCLGQAAAAQVVQRGAALRQVQAALVGGLRGLQHARSGQCRRRSASAASGEGFGTSSPASAASCSTASMKPAPWLCMTKPIASPCAPQPKQW